MLRTCPKLMVSVGIATNADRLLNYLLGSRSERGSAIEPLRGVAIPQAIQSLCRSALPATLQDAKGLEISIWLTTDAEIAELNARYRGIYEPTDVLSFPMALEENSSARGLGVPPKHSMELHARGLGVSPKHSMEPHERDAWATEMPVLLGEVVVSVETAARQAEPNGHDLITEILMLCLHGVLHLLGYDDQTDAQRDEMNRIAVQTLRKLGYPAKEEWCSRHYER